LNNQGYAAYLIISRKDHNLILNALSEHLYLKVLGRSLRCSAGRTTSWHSQPSGEILRAFPGLLKSTASWNTGAQNRSGQGAALDAAVAARRVPA
jgi:hypothetical protein